MSDLESRLAAPPLPPPPPPTTSSSESINQNVSTYLNIASAQRKDEIDSILSWEYGDDVAAPPNAVIRVVDETFCMNGRPVSGFYSREQDAVGEIFYRRIDDQAFPWLIRQHNPGEWWFCVRGGDMMYTIPFESCVHSPAAPPSTGWVTYSATATDHAMMMRGRRCTLLNI